jgi:hypothetical protein
MELKLEAIRDYLLKNNRLLVINSLGTLKKLERRRNNKKTSSNKEINTVKIKVKCSQAGKVFFQTRTGSKYDIDNGDLELVLDQMTKIKNPLEAGNYTLSAWKPLRSKLVRTGPYIAALIFWMRSQE